MGLGVVCCLSLLLPDCEGRRCGIVTGVGTVSKGPSVSGSDGDSLIRLDSN